MPLPEPFAAKYRLATCKEIRSWSFGQVTAPRTEDPVSWEDELGTLDDQRIFGTVADYQCLCGQYAGQEYQGMVCDRCGVKVTTTGARRERFGHLEIDYDSISHPFDSETLVRCFPVIPAAYLESHSGNPLCVLYERVLVDPSTIATLIEHLTPVATVAVQWNAIDSRVFTRGLGLIARAGDARETPW